MFCAAVVMIVAACGGSGNQAGSGTPVRSGNLIIARSADSLSMNLTTVADNESLWVGQQIMETLYMVKSDGTGVDPALATGYTLSTDQLTWTFHLRKDVKFSNGNPMTSADVVFSLNQARAQATWGFIDVAFENVTAIDPYTIAIHTKYPWAPLLSDVSLFANAIVPKDYGGESAASFYEHPVGTGAFKWGHWNRGRDLQLVRNPYYWQKGLPYLDSVTWTVVPDDNTRALQLRGGQINIDEYPAWSQIGDLSKAQGLTVKNFPSTKEQYLEFNHNIKPFQDVHVRRAISYALDRKAMVHAAVFDHGQPANSLLAPTDLYYNPNAGGLQYDVNAAKKEMAQSTVPQGFTTTLLVSSGVAEQDSGAQIVQAMLKPLGITVNLKAEDPTTANQDVQNMTYPMSFSVWTMDITDPDELVSFAEDPSNGSHAFFTDYNNPQVVAWTKQAAQTFNTTERKKVYDQIQVQIAKDAQMGFLYYEPYPWAFSTRVHNFDVTPMANYPLATTWLSPGS